MKKQNTWRGFTQENIKNKVILNLIQDLPRTLLRKHKINDKHGRFQIKFGMTSLCHNGGFTLIELLVVVLIIGILAAVALPQYQYAVEKSRLAGAMTTVATLQKAVDTWQLENGTPTKQIFFLGNKSNGNGALDIDITSDMDCSAMWDATVCKGPDFAFSAICGVRGDCAVSIWRVTGGIIPYVVTVGKDSPNSSWHGSECDYFEHSPSYAEKICKELEAQGNGYYACYEC